MSGAFIIKRRRNGAMGGDPRESDRLRLPFRRWIGNRSNIAGLDAAGIPRSHGCAWLAGTTILADRYQIVVRRILDESGILKSPCA